MPAHLAALTALWRLSADEVFVSAASVWEIAIKHALGNGDMPVSVAQVVQAFVDAGYSMLQIRAEHAVRVEEFPPLHRDPFDRLLAAQALTEPLTLLTGNRTVAKYATPSFNSRPCNALLSTVVVERLGTASGPAAAAGCRPAA